MMGVTALGGALFADTCCEPLEPWSENSLSVNRGKLRQIHAKLAGILDEKKFKITDIHALLSRDPFLITLPIRSGQTRYILRNEKSFLNGSSLVIQLALRGSETVSGPLRKEIEEKLSSYKLIIEETMRYYDDQVRILDRQRGLQIGYPEGLLVYEKPHTSNPRLQGIYEELWRVEDAIPGGTAGVLLHETRTQSELKHLQKAQDRIKNLNFFLKEKTELLSSEDRKVAGQVLRSLVAAVKEALK